MKKFCSSCGSQLELSKRNCTECGAANPFFIANFTLLEDQTNELERLKQEKERIEKELAEKEAFQIEFQRQEQLKKELEELERQKKETLEKERQIREALEQGPEVELKNELIKVKRETEQYKKETLDLLQEIREELKQKAEQLNQQQAKALVTKPAAVTEPEKTEATKAPFIYEPEQKAFPVKMVAALVILLVIGFASAWAYLNFNGKTVPPQEAQTTEQPGAVEPENVTITDTNPDDNSLNVSETVDTSGMGQANSASNPPLIAEAGVTTKPAVTASVDTVKPRLAFELSVSRAMNDLIGKKLSGCNIVIRSVSEIDHITHPVLIEKFSSGYLKYKLYVEVSQNNETYHSTPYVYYTGDGRFLKVDGTNCE